MRVADPVASIHFLGKASRIGFGCTLFGGHCQSSRGDEDTGARKSTKSREKGLGKRVLFLWIAKCGDAEARSWCDA